MLEIKDYPKTRCVYERVSGKDDAGCDRYMVTSTLMEGMGWVFENGVRAVDKLHGTNACLLLSKDREILAIDNRKERVYNGVITTNRKQAMFLEGVLNTIGTKSWLNGIVYDKDVNRVYGELVGPKINGNIHGLDKHFFVPFEYLYNRCHWKTWLMNEYPKNFESLSEWFKELPSLFSMKCGKPGLAEGLIFRHPDGRVAKLRRDMFAWYS